MDILENLDQTFKSMVSNNSILKEPPSDLSRWANSLKARRQLVTSSGYAMSKYIVAVLCMALASACQPNNTSLAKDITESKLASSQYSWLANLRWTPRQTDQAIYFFQDAYYKSSDVVEKMIVEKLAAEGHMDAIYALEVAKLMNYIRNSDTDYPYDDKKHYSKVLYDLAAKGQLNAKENVILFYNDYRFYEDSAETNYQLLKEFSNHQSDKVLA